jgi:hypothetical protein
MFAILVGFWKKTFFPKHPPMDYFHALATGEGTGKNVGDKIHIRPDKLNHGLDQEGRHERTVGADSDNPSGVGGHRNIAKPRPDVL